MLTPESKVQVRVFELSVARSEALESERRFLRESSLSPLTLPDLLLRTWDVLTAVVRSTSARVRVPLLVRLAALVSVMPPVAEPAPTVIVGASLTGLMVTSIVLVAVRAPPEPELPKSLTTKVMISEPLASWFPR